jgi:hypothetical protein
LVRAVDPDWKPTPGLYDHENPDPEGEIAALEAQTGEAQVRFAEVNGVGATPARRGGHHYFPGALYDSSEDVPLQAATRNVFKDASSGPLADPSAN